MDLPPICSTKHVPSAIHDAMKVIFDELVGSHFCNKNKNNQPKWQYRTERMCASHTFIRACCNELQLVGIAIFFFLHCENAATRARTSGQVHVTDIGQCFFFFFYRKLRLRRRFVFRINYVLIFLAFCISPNPNRLAFAKILHILWKSDQ